ncbi:SpoIIE family protein phosphatase [Sanguibacter antarcticus]|uniref:Serine phosphatase RsbU (Regulator of sigma subunit) n=1 Tax=Sanguibacter antarcticus TaxID=372484 RepID=A0A2A9E659_9MICO|nr:SpoIIE family protein phosphatase [Sanguibacter antarcticus]PFG34448.1 serine phosphatase RsbU (regulator of sigma subunit) [Sanguibacter antarcticus]
MVAPPTDRVGSPDDAGLGEPTDVSAVHQLEAMPTAYFSLDTDWCFSYINAAGEKLLGSTRTELLGGNVWDLFPDAVGSDFETHYRSAMSTGQPVVFEAYYPRPLDTTYEVHAWPGRDSLGVYFQDITQRRRAQEAADRDARRDALLSEVGSCLAETLDAEHALDRLAEVLVPALADWCVVTLVEDGSDGSSNRLRDLGCAHVDPTARPLVERYTSLRMAALTQDSYIARAMEDGEVVRITSGATAAVRAVLVPGEARDLIDELAPESVTVLVLQGRGRTMGLVSLFNGAGRTAMSSDDLTVAQEVATRAGLALDNMRLYRQQRQLAEGLQRSLLTAPVQPDHVQIAVRYVPATEAAQVGGDWYDAFLQRTGDTVLVIGDVVGHDIAAAAKMGEIRSMLRGIAVATGASPAELLREIDTALETLQSEVVATTVVARIEQSPDQLERGERTVRWSNAGHPPPMVVRADGTVTPLVAATTNLLLGITLDTQRTETTAILEAGATVFLYTDGLVERRDRTLRDGQAALVAALESVADLDLEELCDEMLVRMLPPTRQDDIAIVAVRLHPQDRSRPAEAGETDVPETAPPDPAADVPGA